MSWFAGYWLPRALHPGAWWLWALALAVAASRTTNPVLLLSIATVAALVVAARRQNAPWALAFRMYVVVAAFVVVMRVLFRLLFNGNGPTILFTLPEVHLPAVMAGIQLLGPVSAESLLSGLYDGLRLGTMIVCIGAANALANPKRLLAAVPAALYELGTVLVVTMSVFPQLAESAQRVNRAKSLRSKRTKGRGWIRRVIVPVLADALDRSLELAAAMDSRGYGRSGNVPVATRRLTSVLLVAGMLALMVGVYGLMDGTTPRYLGLPMLIVGAVIGVVALRLAGLSVHRTRYRPDRWRAVEILVVTTGVVTAAIFYTTSRFDPMVICPSLYPITFPTVSLPALLAIAVAAIPAVATPAPPRAVFGVPAVSQASPAAGDRTAA